MTVIRPNSVSGITSITAQANEINFFRSNGTLAGLQLNGVNFNTTTGVSTFNNLNVGGVLTYQDVTNVDSVGIGTFGEGIFVPDDKSIRVGGSFSNPDLKIHSSSTYQQGIIDYNRSGTGRALRIRATNLQIENWNGLTPTVKVIGGVGAGHVELNYAGSKKFETTSSGVSIGGTTIITSASGGRLGIGTDLFGATKLDVFEPTGTNSTRSLVRFQKDHTSTSVTGSTGAVDQYPHALILENQDNSADTGTVSLAFSKYSSGVQSQAIIAGIQESAGNMALTLNTESGNSISEGLRIESDGQVVINRSSGAVLANSTSKLEVFNSTENLIFIANSTAATSQDAGIIFAPANNVYGGKIIVTSDEDFSTSANRSAHMAFYTRKDGTAAERLRITSDGILNAPTQAGFYARMNSNKNDKTGNGDYYTVEWDTDSGSICYDQHNTFSTSTGLYTIPTGGDGVYQFSTAVCLSTDVYGRQGEGWFLTNTGLRIFFDRRYFPSATGTITGFYGSCTAKMTAGQTIGVQIFVSGGSKNVDVLGAGVSDHISLFTGRKIA